MLIFGGSGVSGAINCGDTSRFFGRRRVDLLTVIPGSRGFLA